MKVLVFFRDNLNLKYKLRFTRDKLQTHAVINEHSAGCDSKIIKISCCYSFLQQQSIIEFFFYHALSRKVFFLLIFFLNIERNNNGRKRLDVK